jgi:hypothetical protein
MGKKLLVALSLEGKFAGEGLQALDDDADMLTAMARELVEKSRIGESADAVWRQLNGEHQRLFRTTANLPVSEPLPGAKQQPPAAPMLPVLAVGGRAPGWKRGRADHALQGSLFE